jgi:hypothetical protein
MKSIFKITLFSILISQFLFCQSDDAKVYFNHNKVKRSILPRQYITKLILEPDSTYLEKSFSGSLDDNVDNYKNWELTESSGKWQIDKRTLTLRRGDTQRRYKITKNHIKPRRIQITSNGGKAWIFMKWAFEKRTKYKLIKN